jgi:hypothetical protein
MKGSLLAIIFLIASPILNAGKPPAKEFYEIRIYQYTTMEQESTIDGFLEKALLPALHGSKIKAGVFKPLSNDTASVKKIYVLIPFKNPAQAIEISEKMLQDKTYLEA